MMSNRIYDSVLINLLQKGPTTSSIDEIAKQFMGPQSVSARYKQSVRAFSVDTFDGENTLFPNCDEHRKLFHWQYQPRVYRVFGFFDLAVLQLCDSVEIIHELSAQPRVSATQNIFGLRTLVTLPDGQELGTRELCSPLLPYICICNTKVHPLLQMVLGKELQSLLTLHLRAYLDEVQVFGASAKAEGAEKLLTVTVIDTYGWNDLTVLIHGSRLDHMLDFVWNDIRALRTADLLTALEQHGLADRAEGIRHSITRLMRTLSGFSLSSEEDARALLETPLFTYTDTVPGIDYRLGETLLQSPALTGSTRESALAVMREKIGHDLRSRIEKNSYESLYLHRVHPRQLGPVVDRIIDDMTQDAAGCDSGFSIRPGWDLAFHRIMPQLLGESIAQAERTDVVLGQYDALIRQGAAGPGAPERGLLDRIQSVIRLRHPAKSEVEPRQRQLYRQLQALILASKTSISCPVSLRRGAAQGDPFDTLRRNFPRVFQFKGNPDDTEAAFSVLSVHCKRIQMPKPIQISLEHTLEPFYSFLENPSLFSQYLDLYLPLLLIARQIQRAAEGCPDGHRPVSEHVSREVRQFNRAFQARFQASHLNSESTETSLEFKAHTVTPLDMIQCIIDCFIGLFIGLDKVAGFPLISVSSRPYVHVSRIFSVELNSFHLLYPESLLVVFHELGHLYTRYRGVPRSEQVRSSLIGGSCLERFFKVEDRHVLNRLLAFTALIPTEPRQLPVDPRHVAAHAEEILADLLLLTSICRDDWELYLWHAMIQVETHSECFPDEPPADDPDQIAFYREIMLRHFLVYVFWRCGASESSEEWRREVCFTAFREFSHRLRDRSKKLRDFSTQGNIEELDRSAWSLVEAFAQPEVSLRPDYRGRPMFRSEYGFWSLDATDKIDEHPGLPAMLMSLIFENYRWMLKDVLATQLLSATDEELDRLENKLDVELERLAAGDASIEELRSLLDLSFAESRSEPMRDLDHLRSASSRGSERQTTSLHGGSEQPIETRVALARGYRRMTRALFALVKFFQQQTSDDDDDLRYLYRDPETGMPECFQQGRSDVEESPCFERNRPPKEVVIDRRGVFFCRSTASRQKAFQYRNGVIRELADIHYELRPVKLAEISRIARTYREDLLPDPGR